MAARKFGAPALATWWLLLASLVFCAWATPKDAIVLAASLAVNYLLGGALHATSVQERRKLLLVFGLVFDCGLLLVFKYAGFFVSILNQATGSSMSARALWLPLGISFYTFVQIYYLLDIYRNESAPVTFAEYLQQVTFFPKFVAGPIMRPVSPPERVHSLHFSQDTVAVGAAMFAMGLAKKLLADHCAQWVGPVFGAAETPGHVLGMCDAWIGALAYTFQIYFDFSGYCDMAIGLGAFFGWRLPVNFNSPYRARSIIDFWRRWHITLTAFLTENVFFQLPGQRKGVAWRRMNLMITMTLCGLWHGAGWTYVIWGAFHGVCLLVNHTWREARASSSWNKAHAPWAGQALTFLCVVLGWVLFAARTARGGLRLILQMFGLGGPVGPQLFDITTVAWAALWLVVLGALACAGPNTQETVARGKARIAAMAVGVRSLRPSWIVPGLVTLWIIAVMLFLTAGTGGGSPFIYAIF